MHKPAPPGPTTKSTVVEGAVFTAHMLEPFSHAALQSSTTELLGTSAAGSHHDFGMRLRLTSLVEEHTESNGFGLPMPMKNNVISFTLAIRVRVEASYTCSRLICSMPKTEARVDRVKIKPGIMSTGLSFQQLCQVTPRLCAVR